MPLCLLPRAAISIRAPTRGATTCKGDSSYKRGISIRAPTRGATICFSSCLPSSVKFQSALPRGERRFNRTVFHGRRYFNPRSHEGSDASFSTSTAFLCYFNPRSHEGSDGVSFTIKDKTANFNPRSHEGSDSESLKVKTGIMISIRAPTRGATSSEYLFRLSPNYFNPRSHEGSDLPQSGNGKEALHFNPRSHEGSDGNSCLYVNEMLLFQSALPRGERQCRSGGIYPHNIYFNPRSHEGSDLYSAAGKASTRHFNPRSHEGSDSTRTTKMQSQSDFNPRSHEGSDEISGTFADILMISIRAPTRGATRKSF